MNTDPPFSLRTISLFCLILFLPPILVYVLNFNKQELSDSGSDWADFATFFGSILGPVYALLNILVVYYLALKVEGIEDTRRQSDEIQEDRRRKNDFKYNAYRELREIILQLIKYCINNDSDSPILLIQFKYALASYSKLFVSLPDERVKKLTDQATRLDELNKGEKLELISELNLTLQQLAGELGF